MCAEAMNRAGRYFSTAFAIALLLLVACNRQPAEQRVTFNGAVKAGERFQYRFGGRFIFPRFIFTLSHVSSGG